MNNNKFVYFPEPTLAIIGTLATSNFIRHLILSLIFQFGVMTFGRCELYLVVPPPLYIVRNFMHKLKKNY